jgi:putative ABC transport system permease protein
MMALLSHIAADVRYSLRSLRRHTGFTIVAVGVLALAGIGIFGVVAHNVSLRVQEIGVRMALGARASDVQRLIVRQVMATTAVGILLGLVGALVSMRLMAAMFYEVSAHDPLIIGGAALVLAIVSATASWLPAFRASRIDPLIALHDQ